MQILFISGLNENRKHDATVQWNKPDSETKRRRTMRTVRYRTVRYRTVRYRTVRYRTITPPYYSWSAELFAGTVL